MTTKQINAAERMIKKLQNIREQLYKTNTADSITLEQVTTAALQSNAACLSILKERVALERKFAGV